MVNFWNCLKSTSRMQLECKLFPLETFLDNYVVSSPAKSNLQIAKNAKTFVDQAKAEMDTNVQQAWASYYDAELLHYKLLEPAEIEARAAAILFGDVCILDDGEKKRVRRLIGVDAGTGDWKLKSPLTVYNFIEARRVVQDHYNHQYTHLHMALKQLLILAITALALSSFIILGVLNVPNNSFEFDSFSAANFAASNVTATNFNATNFVATNFTATEITASNPNQVSSNNWVFWITIGLFGAIGGAISGLYDLKQAHSTKCDIPERVLNTWLTIAKPLVGFAAAIIIAVFLIVGLVQAANITMGNYLIYAMAVISGFSERLIIGAVEERLPSSS